MNELRRIFILACLVGVVLAGLGCRREEAMPPAAPLVASPREVVSQPAERHEPPASVSPALGETTPPSQSAGAADPGPKTEVALPKDSLPPTVQVASLGASLGKGKRKEADALFQQPTLLRIQIEIPPAGLSALRKTRWENDNRPEVKATVREGGQVYKDVAVHLKGAVGSFRSVDDKPALTLKFDKFLPDQRFHGLNKISLNNSVQDSSYLCEQIGRELFLAAGVPTPRAGHALVELNGRPLGLYVMLEGANKQFLKRHFENAKGNLYDGGFCRDIGSRLSVNSGDDPNNQAGLRALRAAVRSQNFALLEKALDVDRFLSMVALEMILGHWDGYTLNKNNWRVFHDLDANRMVFIPHGMDQLFGAGRQFDPDGSLLPHNVQGQVAKAVLATKEGQQRYRTRVEQVYRSVFRAEVIVARIDELVAGLSQALAETDPRAARAFQQRASSLKHRVLRRDAGLRQQLGAPLETVEFGSDGMLPLTGWKQSMVLAGDPELTQGQDETGRTCLGISAHGPSTGSWRTRVALSPGRYRLEGRMRLAGVVVEEGDTRSGAGLRISKGAMPPKITGTTDWKEFKHTFDVTERAADVEMVCELKATAGQAWFETGSLRLVKVR